MSKHKYLLITLVCWICLKIKCLVFLFFFLLFSLVCIFRYSDCRCLNWFIISPPFIISSCQFYVRFRYSNDKWRCIVILLSISLTARLVYALLVWLPFEVTWKRKYFIYWLLVNKISYVATYSSPSPLWSLLVYERKSSCHVYTALLAAIDCRYFIFTYSSYSLAFSDQALLDLMVAPLCFLCDYFYYLFHCL